MLREGHVISKGVPAVIDDPLLRRLELPHEATYYPLGFHLNLISNSTKVHDAAREGWESYTAKFNLPPVEIRIVVEGSGELPAEPAFRSQGSLLTIVADRDNHACLDLESLFGYAFVTQEVVDHRPWFRWFFLEAIAYAALAQRYVVPLHAACVERDGKGLLLCGPSAAGKSTLAFACARSGFTYISDDATMLLQDAEDRRVIGKPHQARFRNDAVRWFPELEGACSAERPNGKIAIETSTRPFTHIQTATQSAIDGLVWIQRGGGPSLQPAHAHDVLRESLRDASYYSAEVQARHELALARLMQAPAYRLQYDRLEDAVALLAQL